MWARYLSLGLISLFSLPLSLKAESYKPYPVIFVHGINSNATTWGFAFSDSEITRGVDLDIIDHSWRFDQHTALHFSQLMQPYLKTRGRDTLWFIAALNFDDFGGSIDPGDYESNNEVESLYVASDGSVDTVTIPLANKGSGYELRHFIYKVLRTYYGLNWRNNPHAKVVLVAHSMGGVIVEEALHQDIKQMEGGST